MNLRQISGFLIAGGLLVTAVGCSSNPGEAGNKKPQPPPANIDPVTGKARAGTENGAAPAAPGANQGPATSGQ